MGRRAAPIVKSQRSRLSTPQVASELTARNRIGGAGPTRYLGSSTVPGSQSEPAIGANSSRTADIRPKTCKARDTGSDIQISGTSPFAVSFARTAASIPSALIGRSLVRRITLTQIKLSGRPLAYWAMDLKMTPFIVTSDEERQAAFDRIELLSKFPPGSPEAIERQALLEAIEVFEANGGNSIEYIEDRS
jgi:hypothetical protein